MIKGTKLKCECGCPMTLYLADWEDGQLIIGSEKNARKGFKNYKGVVVDKKKLLSLIKLT